MGCLFWLLSLIAGIWALARVADRDWKQAVYLGIAAGALALFGAVCELVERAYAARPEGGVGSAPRGDLDEEEQ